MRTLFLLRHAKSSWSDPDLEDIDRPLNARGQKAAAKMGGYMALNDLSPGLILCSSARRTRETLARLIPSLPRKVEIVTLDEVYHAGSPGALATLIRQNGGNHQSLLLIGHNPVIHDFAMEYGIGGDPRLKNLMQLKYPTGALSEISFEIEDWQSLAPNGRLIRFIPPRSL